MSVWLVAYTHDHWGANAVESDPHTLSVQYMEYYKPIDVYMCVRAEGGWCTFQTSVDAITCQEEKYFNFSA